jgi:hypothetical protein
VVLPIQEPGLLSVQSPVIPGWPYSFVAAVEPGRTSWTAVLDVLRLRPWDDAIAVTAGQVREVFRRLCGRPVADRRPDCCDRL